VRGADAPLSLPSVGKVATAGVGTVPGAAAEVAPGEAAAVGAAAVVGPAAAVAGGVAGAVGVATVGAFGAACGGASEGLGAVIQERVLTSTQTVVTAPAGCVRVTAASRPAAARSGEAVWFMAALQQGACRRRLVPALCSVPTGYRYSPPQRGAGTVPASPAAGVSSALQP
jgi:hypothetical protein